MPHHPKPYYRAQRKTWCVQIDGKQISLGPDRDEAFRTYHRLMAEGRKVEPKADLTVAEVVDLFLEHSQVVHDPGTYKVNRSRLQQVVNQFGRVIVSKLRVSAIEQWLAKLTCSQATKRGYLVVLRTAINWCRSENFLTGENPLTRVKLPRMTRRGRLLTPEEREGLLRVASPAFRDLLFALTESGARPHIIQEMEAKHIDRRARTATVISKRRPYVVQLTERLAKRLEELAKVHPDGPLLRNTEGRPWNASSTRLAFKRYCDKLKIPIVTAYSYRHSFVTDALAAGSNPAVLAALVNHVDLTMISQHYNHVAERSAILQAEAERAARASSGGPPLPVAKGRNGRPRRPPR
jgi:integrase